MTAEEIREMTGEQIEARLAEIRETLDNNSDDVDIEMLTQEVDELRAAKQAKIDAEEKRQALLNDIAVEKEPVAVTPIEVEPEVRKVKTIDEIRSGKDYALAYSKLITRNDDTEVRTLLSDQVEGGYVPVPTFLEEKIQTAWEKNELMGLVKKSSFKGIVKVGFELSASAASVHVEGTAAPNEETLTLGTVSITPQTIKKWIRLSDEAIDNTTIDTVDYIYDEITQRIIEKVEELIITAISSLTATATATQVNVGVISVSALAVDTILNAVVTLQSGAKDLHLVMNRATYAALRAIELGGNYAIDVFEGLKDKIVYSDVLPSFASASTGDTVIIVGDFGLGCQVNTPAGDGVKITVDPYTGAEADLVKFVGKQNIGIGIVAPKAFAKVTKAAAEG